MVGLKPSAGEWYCMVQLDSRQGGRVEGEWEGSELGVPLRENGIRGAVIKDRFYLEGPTARAYLTSMMEWTRRIGTPWSSRKNEGGYQSRRTR